MLTLILVVHVLAAVGIVVFVLLQHGKGADMGAAFGSGSAGSLFGSAGRPTSCRARPASSPPSSSRPRSASPTFIRRPLRRAA